MRNVKQSNVNIHRDSWVEINLDYLAQNIKAIRSQTPKDVKLLAVVKADAYGHGAVMLAPTLHCKRSLICLASPSIDEGADLRNAKISADILVLGAVPVWAVRKRNEIRFGNLCFFKRTHHSLPPGV